MKSLVTCLIGILVIPQAVAAHRLDEYLQATRIALASDGIAVEIDLTPGVAVAPQILRVIDANGDTRIDPSELAAYARSVLRDVTIDVDGRRYALELIKTESAPWGELAEGMGAIRLEARAQTPLHGGRHVVRFENGHQRAMSVYLVNTLVPSTRSIAVLAQQRDERQRGIEIDVKVAGPAASLTWLLAPLVALGGLVLARTTRSGGPSLRSLSSRALMDVVQNRD